MQMKTNSIISDTYKYLNKFGCLTYLDPLKKPVGIFQHEAVDVTNALSFSLPR